MLFGSGFGPTVPAVATGEVVATPLPLANAVKLHIGNTPATLEYAGLTGTGLYQLNVLVPRIAAGEHPVTAEVGGVRTQAFAILTVA